MEPQNIQNNVPNMEPQQEHHLATREVLLPIIAIVLLIAIAFAISTLRGTPAQEVTQENVVVASASEQSRVPAGFPSDIPVEIENVTESLSMTYPDRSVVLHTVSYVSSDTPMGMYTDYLLYMNSAGYQFPATGRNEELGTLYGYKNGDEMSVILSERNGGTLVQINYLDRQ